MANRTFPVRMVPRAVQLWEELENESIPWINAPTFGWECKIDALDFAGSYATLASTITIPSSGFVSGRLTVTFSGDALESDVVLTADAAVGEDETDLGAAIASVIQTEVDPAGDLEDIAIDVQDNMDGTVVVTFAQGIGSMTVTATFDPAQQIETVLSGTLIDADYNITISGGGLGAPVTSPTTRAGGSPANIAALVVQIEADLEGLIPTTLADVLVSADDDGSDTNLLIFEPGIPDVTVTASTDPQSISIQFGGTETDGTYQSTITHASLPGGSFPVETPRSGTPATNADLAVQHEADIEGETALYTIVASADDDGTDSVILIGQPGVSGISVTTSAPSPGTLTATDLEFAVNDVTPAGPTVTVSYSVVLDLNSISDDAGFPANVLREWCFCNVVTAFGASRTLTVGDAGDPDGILGSTPIDLNTTGRSSSIAADGEYQPRPEATYTPIATIDLGSSPSVTAGEARVEILFTPNLLNTGT